MTTATKSRKPQTRKATVNRTTCGRLLLWLTVGEDVRVYGVTPLPCQMGGRAFHLQKANRGDGHAEEYDVRIDGERSTCECQGFLRHGLCKDGKGCKHIAGLSAVIAAGLLPAGVPVVIPVEQPAPEVCAFDNR